MPTKGTIPAICQQCGKPFLGFAGTQNKRLFCSRACNMAHRNPPQPANYTCDYCGKRFRRREKELNTHSHNFCTTACRIQWLKHRPFADRFWGKVAVGAPDDCWEWQGGRHRDGYGTISISGENKRTHRVAYELIYGPIPDDKHVLHSCDNPPCCNPAHLRTGTVSENAIDMVSRNRHNAAARPETILRGEQVNTARLTEDQVRDIRKRCESGQSQGSIARHFGVSKACIGAISRRKNWRHID